jgi:hypothetical protein
VKVTKADYELFKNECESFIATLGLKEWQVHYSNEETDDTYARTYMNSGGMVATIVMSRSWDDMRPKDESSIRRLAFHEVCHLLMSPLCNEARERYTTLNNLEQLEHTIIRRLENLV